MSVGDEHERAPSAVARALREAARFDRSAVSLRAGLIATIPVAGVLAAGTLAGDKVAAVTMGAGAMLVGVAWRVRGGTPPVSAMALDTAFMGLSTFAGAASGHIVWLHLILLAVWGLAGGMIAAAGGRTAIVGVQGIIAMVVFGRFSQPVPQALGLAGLVAAGGATQVLFCALFGAPVALRLQRAAVAEAYRQLAALALEQGARTAPAAAALDEAELKLVSPTLLGDAAMMALSGLVDEGRRIRLELTALSVLVDQYPSERDRGSAATLRRATELARDGTARVLLVIAATVEGDAPATELSEPLQGLRGAVEQLTLTVAALRSSAELISPEIADRLERHAAALAGQARAAAGLAAGVHERRGRVAVRPSLGATRPFSRLAAEIGQIRANASLQSPAARHAVRLAVIVPTTELLAEHTPLQRDYWIVVAAATVLRPDFAATFTRAAERMAGTCIGAVLAGLLAVAVHPTGWITVGLVAILAWGAYAVFAASFAVGTAFLTAMVVFLLNAVAPDSLATAFDRGIDTIIGGAIGLIAYSVWPTWSRTPARQALAALAAAQRDYIRAVLAALTGDRSGGEDELRSLARRARLAWTNAEATVERSLTEPAARRIDVEQARGVMTGLRRLVQAAHVIRLEPGAGRPLPALRELATALDRTLSITAQTLATGVAASAELPPLRALHRELARTVQDGVLMTELDEMVDAANTVSGLLGLEPIRERPTPAGRRYGSA